LASLLTSRAQQVTALVVFAALLAVGFLPLFGGPGYESSLASGLLLPCAASIATAFDLAFKAPSPLGCVRRGFASGLLLSGIALLTAFLHGLRVGFCDLSGGTTLFVLTAGFGACLGGLWGAIAAEIMRSFAPSGPATGVPARTHVLAKRVACVFLAMSAPLAGIAVSVARFYGSPMIFAYDPFFGYFSGTLYDTVVDARPELWTYRAGSAATLLGAGLISAALVRTDKGRAVLGSLRGSARTGTCLGLGFFALVVSVEITAHGSALGHFQSAATIARALGGRVSGPRCDVIYPDSVLARDAQTMLLDCEQELAAVERRLATHLEGRLTVFEFADPDQKRRLMGAAETSIAKPWRREAYVQVAAYPHPVLGHEIAHVVASSFAVGPFKVGGGLWPNPGIIEGVAVAASPDDDELTAAEWARAMLDVGLLPPSQQVFSLGFLGQSAERSYTVAGAFVGWVMERWGLPIVQQWYRGDAIETLTHYDWDGLDREFRAWLGTKPLPAAGVEYARAKFGRSSVWRRTCPHVVDALDAAGDRCRDEHRFGAAVDLYDKALNRDPDDWHARFSRSWALTAGGQRQTGLDGFRRIVGDETAPRTWRDRAEEAVADDALLYGRELEAAELFQSVASRTPNEDYARTLEVKALGASSPLGKRAIIDLLIGEPGHVQDAWLGALSTAEWADATHQPLAEYLLGKNLALRSQWTRAALHLDRALAGGAPTARVGRELLRSRAICACASGDEEALDRTRFAIVTEGSPFAEGAGGRRDWALRLVERCAAALAR
jgi:tetratricopeptide (TPR) repeat protein